MDREELGRVLDEGGIPRGDIYCAPEMLEDVHFRARKEIVEIADPVLGKLKMQNVFPLLSDTPGAVTASGPTLGQHNPYVLQGLLGYGDERIAALVAAGIIGKVAEAAPVAGFRRIEVASFVDPKRVPQMPMQWWRRWATKASRWRASACLP